DENGNGPCDVCENDPCTCDENGNGPCDVCENDPCTCDENGNGPCDVCENDPCTCDENGNGNGNEPGCKCGADCKCSPGNCLCNNIVCTCPRQPTQGIDLLTRHAFLIGACCGNMLPGNAITRAEAATIFFRLMSDDQRTQHWYQENDFPDVSLEQWFNNAVSTTTAAGFFEGRPDGSFAPQTPITRAEFATVVVRMMGVSYQGPLRFPDIEGHWAEAAINAAAAEGWVVGMEDGMFRPDQSMTRAEAAAMINRKEGRVAPCEESKLPHMLRFPDNTNTEAWYYLYIKSATNSYQSMTDGRAYDYGYVSGLYEFWIRLLPHRDWTVLERPDSRPEDIFG
ncbi:MAG: S-layer homology domain-containing protein, partial [Oscillospiraceae bacterium]|nr:S-layer homology domain-containing protein [Oscillospiraceae bacterium]